MNSGFGANITSTIAQGIAGMVGSLLVIKPTNIGDTSNNTNKNNTFNITAEFSNANSVAEIQEAILSLPNLASQYLSQC